MTNSSAAKPLSEHPAPTLEPGSTAHVNAFRQQMGNISRHSSVFLAGTVFTAIAGYLFKVYLARVLGASALGVYTLGMTIVGFLGIFNALGLPKSAVRFVATYCGTGQLDRLRGFLGRSLVLLLGCNLVLGAMLLLVGPWVTVHFYHTTAVSEYMWLFALIMVLGVLNTFFGEVLVGYKAVAQRTVITSFISSPTAMMFTFALVSMGFGLRGYILAQVLSACVVLALLIMTVWKRTPRAVRTLGTRFPPLEKSLVSFSAAVFSLGLLGFLTGTADKVLIGFYLDTRSVGRYAMASSLVTFVPILLQSVNQIFSPTIADLYARNQHELLGRLFQTLTRWIFGLTIPMALVLMLFAPALMGIFGPDFVAAWPILVIGTLGQLINCGVGSAGTLLLMSGNQRSLLMIQTVMAVLMVVLNLVLIPRWNITGAAIAAAVTVSFSNFCYLYEVRKRMGLTPYNRSYRRLLAPVFGTTLAILLVRSKFSETPGWISVAVALVLGYMVFLAIAILLGLDADDRVIAKAVWSRFRGMFSPEEVTL